MATSIESIHDEIVDIKKDLNFIKYILSEKSELSAFAKKQLKEARETSEENYIDLK